VQDHRRTQRRRSAEQRAYTAIPKRPEGDPETALPAINFGWPKAEVRRIAAPPGRENHSLYPGLSLASASKKEKLQSHRNFTERGRR
jgi:hypothetical protein